MQLKIESKHLIFRLVELEDADFIFNLRKIRGRFLSSTESIEKQIEFLKRYKEKEKNGEEFYFMILNKKNNTNLGVVRIYDLKIINNMRSFCWGSWIIVPTAPKYTALESALLIYEFGFYIMHMDMSHFDVVKENTKVISFHKKMGAKVINEDDKNYYFHYLKSDYTNVRNKYYEKFILN